MKILLSIFLTSLLAAAVSAQSALTNGDVLDLIRSGLSTEIVVAKIKASDARFDTSTPTLLKLRDAKVPDAIVLAMLDKEREGRTQANVERRATDDALADFSEHGTLADLRGRKKAYVITEFLKARDFIVKELLGAGFSIVGKIEDAEFYIQYREDKEWVTAKAVQDVGILRVVMEAKDPPSGRVRNIYETKKTKYFIWEEVPAKNAARQFLKDLAKALK